MRAHDAMRQGAGGRLAVGASDANHDQLATWEIEIGGGKRREGKSTILNLPIGDVFRQGDRQAVAWRLASHSSRARLDRLTDIPMTIGSPTMMRDEERASPNLTRVVGYPCDDWISGISARGGQHGIRKRPTIWQARDQAL